MKRRNLRIMRVTERFWWSVVSDEVAEALGIAPALAAEIAFLNDEWLDTEDDAIGKRRFRRIREWAEKAIASYASGPECGRESGQLT